MSTSVATPAFGTLLKIDTSGSGAYTTIAEVVDIEGPELEGSQIEVTHQESPGGTATKMAAREFIGGLVDNGEVDFDINYLPASATHVLLAGKVGDKAPTNFRMVFPNTAATTATFAAFVKRFKPKAPVDDKLSASVVLKVTGLVVFS